MSDNVTTDNTIMLDTGGVEYSLEDAVISIQDLIDALEEAQENGAEYVTMSSGNSRGARYMKPRASYDYLD